MKMTDTIFKVLGGSATAGEHRAVKAWVSHSRGNREEYENLSMLWAASRGAAAERRRGDDNEGFRRIREAVTRRRDRRRRTTRVFGVALVCGALIMLTTFFATMNSPLPLLVFQDESLRSVLSVVEREYGIEVIADDETLLACPVTVLFYRVDQPDEILRSISDALSADVVNTAPGKYRLTGHGC